MKTRSRLLVGAVALSATALLVGAAAGAAGAVTATADGSGLTVVSVDSSAAPAVRVVVAAPPALAGQTLDAAAFTVHEGGASPTVAVQALPAEQLEVALVIDTSGSMAGAPLSAAKAAAHSLLGQLPASVPVSVVGFGATPLVASAPTTNRSLTLSAVDALQARGETALYDAVDVALKQLPPATATVRPVVVLLSDGGDTASGTTLDAVSGALATAKVPVFAVELKTAESNAAALARLASASGGQSVSAADPTALAAAFDAVAKQLIREYALAWTSTGRGPLDATILLDAGGVQAEATAHLALPAAAAPVGPGATVAPVAPVAPIAAAGPGVLSPGLSSSPAGGGRNAWSWGLPVGSGLFGIALLLVLVPALAFREPKSRALRGGSRLAAANRSLAGVGDHARSLADRLLSVVNRGSALSARIEAAGLDLKASELLVVVSCATVVTGLVGAVVVSSLAGLVCAAATVATAWLVLALLARRRRDRFAAQLGDALQMLAGSLRAGFGLGQAIDVVAREAESPMADEFRRLTVEVRLGRELNHALEAMADRVRSADFAWVVQSFEIHREVGGDLAEVLDNVGATIRDRDRVRRHARALSAEGRLSALVLVSLPLILALIMGAVDPSYLGELTSNGTGWAMIGGGGALLIAGGFWLQRIVKLDF